jgi:hypothetical protein
MMMMTTASKSGFWAKEGSALLWHRIKDPGHSALCGRYISPPRMTMQFAFPLDDVRCAKCDRLIDEEDKQ